jgi:cellobiose-specific phosphotransferase system component IIA
LVHFRFLVFDFLQVAKPNPAEMDAIKKKMQAMKAEKDNAMDRADTCEQQSRDANLRAEKVQSKTFLPDQKEMTTFASLVLFMFRRQLTSINGK